MAGRGAGFNTAKDSSATSATVSYAADRLNKLQFLTIRLYLTLVFLALIVRISLVPIITMGSESMTGLTRIQGRGDRDYRSRQGRR